MTRVVIDQPTRAKFHNLNQAIQFVDEAGHLLGLFTPAADPARLKPQISEEEIERRLTQGGGRTLAEILRDQEKRA